MEILKPLLMRLFRFKNFIVESLSLSPTQRLVLVRIDGGERLVILGEGRVLPVKMEGAPRG